MLKGLLANERVLLTGVGIANDANKLHDDYGLTLAGVVELNAVAGDVLSSRHAAQNRSLSSLSELVLRQHLAKPPDLRTSNWENHPLSPSQVGYAATDAFVGLALAEALAGLLPEEEEGGEGGGEGDEGAGGGAGGGNAGPAGTPSSGLFYPSPESAGVPVGGGVGVGAAGLSRAPTALAQKLARYSRQEPPPRPPPPPPLSAAEAEALGGGSGAERREGAGEGTGGGAGEDMSVEMMGVDAGIATSATPVHASCSTSNTLPASLAASYGATGGTARGGAPRLGCDRTATMLDGNAAVGCGGVGGGGGGGGGGGVKVVGVKRPAGAVGGDVDKENNKRRT